MCVTNVRDLGQIAFKFKFNLQLKNYELTTGNGAQISLRACES